MHGWAHTHVHTTVHTAARTCHTTANFNTQVMRVMLRARTPCVRLSPGQGLVCNRARMLPGLANELATPFATKSFKPCSCQVWSYYYMAKQKNNATLTWGYHRGLVPVVAFGLPNVLALQSTAIWVIWPHVRRIGSEGCRVKALVPLGGRPLYVAILLIVSSAQSI